MVNPHSQPVVEFRVEVGTHRVALHVGGNGQTILLEIAARHEVVGSLGSALNVEVGLVHRGGLVEGVGVPVGVSAMVLIAGVSRGRYDGVLKLEVEQFVGGHRVADAACQLAPTDFLRNAHTGLLAGAAALGGNKDNAVGGTRTVNRSCGSVFKHRYALNVVVAQHSEHSHAARRAIDNYERIARCGDRTDTAHGNRNIREVAHVTGGVEHLHTGHLTLQGIGDVDVRLAGNYFARHLFHRAYHRSDFLGGTVTHNDGFVELVILHNNLNVAGHVYGLRFHADVRNREFLGGSGNVLERELTVFVGNNHDFCPGHSDSRADNRFALRVDNATGYALLCGKRCCTQQHASPEEHKFFVHNINLKLNILFSMIDGHFGFCRQAVPIVMAGVPSLILFVLCSPYI